MSTEPTSESFTVAVVGNAQSLFAQEHGAAIDRHDVVIRMNRAAQLSKDHLGYDRSHGARTDVWCMWRYREYEHARVREPGLRCQMAWWIETPPDPAVFNIDSEWFVHHTLPHTPTTGLMALAWLSRTPAQVSVYGFDWKATPTFTDPQRMGEQHSIHNFSRERELCREYFHKRLGYEFH